MTTRLQKVFCIGLHKTGTTSLAGIATSCGYRTDHSVGWSKRSEEQRGILGNADFFCDGGGHFGPISAADGRIDWGDNHDIGSLLLLQPAATFVLNVRSPQAWLASKLRHAGWRPGSLCYFDEEEVPAHADWRTKNLQFVAKFARNWLEYHQAVLDFFESREVPGGFHIIDYIGNKDSHHTLSRILNFTGNVIREESNKTESRPRIQAFTQHLAGLAMNQAGLAEAASRLCERMGIACDIADEMPGVFNPFRDDSA